MNEKYLNNPPRLSLTADRWICGQTKEACRALRTVMMSALGRALANQVSESLCGDADNLRLLRWEEDLKMIR
ncbi:hypothetical protein CEXT_440701 [Caerostris extrusa]|uniref:Uncharacterized protein n=1 Tax=Caerostris extrusa TaxID=172846 RepID=A0AAV4RG08_CAEEX|nr:hypothetical protein CEXT_440701 [Caerostris extrusa]